MAIKSEASLGINIKDFEAGLNKAASDLSKFASGGIGNLGNLGNAIGQVTGKGSSSFLSLAGSVAKFVPAIGGALGAQEAFSRAMENSQALSDSYAKAQGVLNTVIDDFFKSLTSGDFSMWNQGLDNLIRKAGLAQEAIDQLGNTVMSNTVTQSRLSSEWQKQMTILRGAKKGSEEYNAALARMTELSKEMGVSSKSVQADIEDLLKKDVAAMTGLDPSEVDMSWIEKALELDSNPRRDAYKAAAAKDVEVYKKASEIASQRYGGTAWTDTYGNKHTTGGNAEALAQAQAALNKRYGQSIVQSAMLNKQGDERLKQMGELAQQYYSLEQAVDSYKTQIARLGKDESRTTATHTTTAGGAKDQSAGIAKASIQYEMDQSANPWTIVNDEIARRGAVVVPFSLEPVSEEVLDEDTVNKALGDNDAAARVAALRTEIKGLKSESQDATVNLVSQFVDLGDTLANLGDTYDNCTTAWDYFSTTVKTGLQVFQAFQSIMETINTLTALSSTLKTKEAASSLVSATAAGVDAAAKSTEAAAAGTDATAQVVDASAKTFNAHSWIPFVGIGIAAAMVAVMLATMSSLPKYAEGAYADQPTVGIFGEAGPELVLPEKKLDEAFERNGYGMSGKVEFKIKQNELVGILKQANNISKYR